MKHVNTKTFETRLARLEQSNRRWKALTAGFSLVGVALLAAGFASRQEPEILTAAVLEVGELRVLDANGRAVLLGGSDESGSGYLEISNGAGVPVCFLGTTHGRHGALDLLNEHGQRIVFAGASEAGDGGVRTENADGSRAFYVGDDVRGNGRVPTSSIPGARLR